MGWVFTHREKGEATNAEWFANELFFKGPEITDRYLAHATVSNVFYAAVERTYAADKPTEVFGLVVMTKWIRTGADGSGDWHNFGYKDQSEEMGPVDSAAPAKVLDALDAAGPPPNEWAAEWRGRCRRRLEKRAAAAKVTKGSTVRFAQPLDFTNGAKLQTFTFLGRSTFRGEDLGRYRIPNWRESDFEVVAS